MRYAAAILILAAAPAWAQPSAPPPVPAQPPCAECGVVRSVRSVKHELKRNSMLEETKPSGLVATIPFGGDKARIGPSQKIGRESTARDTHWEVAVRYDDGRYGVFTLGEEPDVKEGDKVRVDEKGNVRRRTD